MKNEEIHFKNTLFYQIFNCIIKSYIFISYNCQYFKTVKKKKKNTYDKKIGFFIHQN
jgi:uncharacterized ion transporter superfamily protein YfcC